MASGDSKISGADDRSKLIFAVRLALALVWLYNGLWLKVIKLDPHHLEIVRSAAAPTSIDPTVMLRTIGGCETLLAVGILTGLFYRFVSYFQIVVVLLMNAIGIIFGGGAIANPIGLLISNLPLIMCALVVAHRGPGAFAMRIKGNNESSAEWI